MYITRRTFICAKGLVKARSLQHAIEKHNAYRVKLLNYNRYCVRYGVMAINPDKRTVYFVFGSTIEVAHSWLETSDRDAMPIVTFKEDLKYFHPDALAHHLDFFSLEEYHSWWIVKRTVR